jgi:hypothetical protein
MMLVCDILERVQNASGTNEKLEILRQNRGNSILVKALRMGHDPFTPFHVVKVPAVTKVLRSVKHQEEDRWNAFFEAADQCAARKVTGNAAVDLLHTALCSASESEEKWMRKILKKQQNKKSSKKNR